MSALLTAEHLRYTYSKKTPFEKEAVKDISFTLEKGETVALIGHTGSGKSTLVQMLNGLLRPQSGRVMLHGTDIWEKGSDIRSVRFQVGLCFQYPEYQLFEETVYADIAFGPKNKGLTGASLDNAVRRAAAFTRLDSSLLSASPFALSGGEKRRVALSGVIAMEPEILILDEPTAGLDPEGRDTVLQGIEEYRRLQNATVLFVTHSMEDAARFADRIVVLNDGAVFQQGTVKEVFSHAEELREIGLGLPQSAELMRLLRRRGFSLPTDIYRTEDAVNALLPFLRKEETNHA